MTSTATSLQMIDARMEMLTTLATLQRNQAESARARREEMASLEATRKGVLSVHPECISTLGIIALQRYVSQLSQRLELALSVIDRHEVQRLDEIFDRASQADEIERQRVQASLQEMRERGDLPAGL